MMKPYLLLLTLCTLLASCATPPPPNAARGEGRDEAALNAVYDRFSKAYADLDPDAVVALYTDDAFYLSGSDSPIRQGKDALVDAFAWLARERESGDQLTLAFRLVDRTVQGGTAFDVGYYQLTRTSADGSRHVGTGKFVTVLIRGDDGQWRFRVDGYSGAPNDAFDARKSP